MATVRGIDPDASGRQVGTIDVAVHDDRHSFSTVPVPVVSLRGGDGPTALLVAGTHGDEFEGQVVLQRLLRELDPAQLAGRLIVVPAANLPAVQAGARTSPLDGGNLNRSYPGSERGLPTEQVADALLGLLGQADVAMDLHSGGSWTFFLPSAFVYAGPDDAAFAHKQKAVDALGLPWSYLVAPRFEPGSFSTACDDAGVPMISTELGGGGHVDRSVVEMARAGVLRVLRHWGVLAEEGVAGVGAPQQPRWIELRPEGVVRTPARGLFEPLVALGEEIEQGQCLGTVHPILEPDAPSVPVPAPTSGVVGVLRRPPVVDLGDRLALVATPA